VCCGAGGAGWYCTCSSIIWTVVECHSCEMMTLCLYGFLFLSYTIVDYYYYYYLCSSALGLYYKYVDMETG
jgi:hypothetical protein